MDLQRIEELLELLNKHDVCEFSFKDSDASIRLRLGSPPPAVSVAPAVAAAPVAAAVASAAPAAAAAGAADVGIGVIEAPMVGTFYRASSPDDDPFVELGQRVTVGQTLCIVEAMKLMNEIEADVTGVVAEILVENADAVQFGQPLFKIRKD